MKERVVQGILWVGIKDLFLRLQANGNFGWFDLKGEIPGS
jgi:hypothetical protein